MATPPQPALQHKKKAPPALSNAYQKAHKIYVLSSALFASWQLIGIELNTKEKWGLELKSPRAVPLILFVMVIYFGYRLIIEWMQCDEERRGTRAALIDFSVAHSIAVIALAIAAIQQLLKIRVADTLFASPYLALVGSVSLPSFGFIGGLAYFKYKFRSNPTKGEGWVAAVSFALLVLQSVLLFDFSPISLFWWCSWAELCVAPDS